MLLKVVVYIFLVSKKKIRQDAHHIAHFFIRGVNP